MYIAICLTALPKYGQFRGTITYNIPWMNNTQVVNFAVDTVQERISYGFENASSQLCDRTVSVNNFTKFGRTKNQSYECQSYAEPYDWSYIPFVPEFNQNWTEMGETTVRGQPVQHFRLVSDYIADQSKGTMDYTEVRTYEQDFYCALDLKTQNCTPVRWYMQSRSNFNSQYGIYELDYSNFEFRIEENDFNFDFYGAVCKQQQSDEGREKRFFEMMRVPKTGEDGEKTVTQLNLEKIQQWRRREDFTFKVAPNHFIDYTQKDFERIRMGKKLAKQITQGPNIYNDSYVLNEPRVEKLPQNLDWRTSGALNMVKDQLFCGSCWTFAATGVLEAQINIRQRQQGLTVPNVQLSEQYLVDCFWGAAHDGFGASHGCQGGDEDGALYAWIGQSKFATEHNYPYLGEDDWCKPHLLDYQSKYKVSAWHRVPMDDVVQMKRALMHGPVAIAISAPETFNYYAGGIYNDPDCSNRYEDIGHAVILVGWGESEYGPYWIIRNCWSPQWGVDGYIYVAMKNNICAITWMGGWIELADV